MGSPANSLAHQITVPQSTLNHARLIISWLRQLGDEFQNMRKVAADTFTDIYAETYESQVYTMSPNSPAAVKLHILELKSRVYKFSLPKIKTWFIKPSAQSTRLKVFRGFVDQLPNSEIDVVRDLKEINLIFRLG